MENIKLRTGNYHGGYDMKVKNFARKRGNGNITSEAENTICKPDGLILKNIEK